MPDLPSLDLLLKTVQAERARMQHHFESLDNKAGLALGFAGVLATLAPDVPLLFRVGGLGLLLVAGILAVAAFWPRGLPTLEVARLRKYLTFAEAHTKLTLHDTLVSMDVEASQLLESKARRLQASLVALVLAVAVFAAGMVYEGLGGGADAGPDARPTAGATS